MRFKILLLVRIFVLVLKQSIPRRIDESTWRIVPEGQSESSPVRSAGLT